MSRRDTTSARRGHQRSHSRTLLQQSQRVADSVPTTDDAPPLPPRGYSKQYYHFFLYVSTVNNGYLKLLGGSATNELFIEFF